MDAVLAVQLQQHLEHHGTKGMRWGVRRVRRLEALGRASKANASGFTKVRAVGNILGKNLPAVTLFDAASLATDNIKGNTNLQGLAKRKFTRTTAREARIKKGKAHVSDYIVHYGSTRVTDFFPTRRSRVNVKSTAKSDKKVVLGSTALILMGLPVP